ncbi:hypothetical protein [Bosea sp. (in: a-proteobacteria)]|uniref:hypothetical protein n=1 Tax=Bosea sp. (in: a-proteobacteria) TaxID=1871050 RepID=UPI001ACA4BD7|nr:hypothetical protein [Bosea sp. (in: a-proteobacteria)]MBN9438250.1 hypothetical protein [Bosea sp. (in: a-proteobacteria)]
MSNEPQPTTPAPTSPASEPVAQTPPVPAAPVAPVDASPSGTPSTAEAPKRPDGLPDQFWDDKDGVKFGDLAKRLGELEALKASHDSRAAAVPDKPDGYELKLPADLKFEAGDGFEIDPGDPMVSFGREVAHKMGLDQSGFEAIVGMYAQHQIELVKTLNAIEAKNVEALGPKGADRQAAVKNWLTAKLGKDAPDAFMGLTATKQGVEYLERLMRPNGGLPSFTQSGREPGRTAAPTEEEYAAMSPAERLVAARKTVSGGR